MKKINIAEILKNCPEGMELDCILFKDTPVYFHEVTTDTNYPIEIKVEHPCKELETFFLNKYGAIYDRPTAKCVIFPKGKTTWEVPPCKFEDGDVIYTDNFIVILSNITEIGTVWYHCYYHIHTKRFKAKHDCGVGNINSDEIRLATEEEKQTLFQVIKDNGYKWNAETKTLEKLPKFKVGDIIKSAYKEDYRYVITHVTDTHYTLEEVEDKFKYTEPISEDKNWELVPDKFDITTLVPFESRVLVRGADGDLWKPAIYGFSHPKGCYVVGGVYWKQCIPYEAYKELLGTTNNIE